MSNFNDNMLESMIFNYRIINKMIYYDYVSIIMLSCIDNL